MSVLRVVLMIISLGYLFIAIACNSVSTPPISPLISPSLALPKQLESSMSMQAPIQQTIELTGEVLNLYDGAFDLLLERIVNGSRTDIVRIEIVKTTVTLDSNGVVSIPPLTSTGINVQVLGHQQEFTPTQIVADQIKLLQPIVSGGMDGPGMEPMYDFAAQVRRVDLSRHLITIQPFAESNMSNSWIYTITVIPSPNGTLVMYAPDPYWEKAALPATLADMTEGTWIEVNGHTLKAGNLQASFVYILLGAPNLAVSTPMMIAIPFTGTTVSVGVDGTPTFTLDGRGRKPGDLALGITVASDCLIIDNKGTPKTFSDLHQGMTVTVLEGEGDAYNFVARRVRIESQ